MAVFPAPDHDHADCADRALRQAESLCRHRGVRLTPQRARVLDVLAQGHRPMGAYEILDALAENGRRPAPITVYRALDFLLAQGLVHRIESRNAFVACMAAEDTHESPVFLICSQCGNVGEALAEGVGAAVERAAEAQGFAPDIAVIEIGGVCRHCAEPTEELP